MVEGQKRSAQELAKLQREISVAEFFTKNRHLLGFDNPKKALLTAIKEAVDNSLTYDMPLIIRQRGKVSIVRIGEFIDNLIKENLNKKELLRRGDLERLPLDKNIEVLAFDKKSLKLDFKNVSTAFRHKVNSKIFRIKLISGRYVDLTEYHSVFTLEKGEIKTIATKDIKEGTALIVPRKKWNIDKPADEINLVEELLLLDESLTKKVNVYGINEFLTDRIIDDIRVLLPKNKKYRINDFKRFNYLPFNILRNLKVDIAHFKDSKLGVSLCKHKIPVIIKMDFNFAELLGLYIAEGSILKNLTRLHFSFGSHEKELIYYTTDLFEKVFGFGLKVRKAHETAYNLIANSSILCFIFKYIIDVGENARNKKIPSIIFNLREELRYCFLMGYLAGDGYPSNEIFMLLKNDCRLDELSVEKITSATASFELYTGIQYLLSSLGMSYSISVKPKSRGVINGIKTNFGKQFYIYIYRDRMRSALNLLPIDDTIFGCCDSKLKYSVSRANQENVVIKSLENGLSNKTVCVYEGVQEFLNSDLGVLRVTSIEEINYDKDWVYDVSVPECENFVAGVGAIICHNSLDACEEAGILPDIRVEIKQIKEDRFRIMVEDNGPGIVKAQIPRIFAKLLYGSKFHRLKMSRGQQGIGISAAAMYGQLTTGKGIEIVSKISPKDQAHFYELQLDTQKNEPRIIQEGVISWDKEHGTKIEIEMESSYAKGKSSVDEYIKQTALANPHASFFYLTPLGERIDFQRVINELPKEPKEIKPHPHGIEIGMLMKMLHGTSKGTISSFLTEEFSRVSAAVSHEICEKANVSPRARPATIAKQEIENLYNAIQQVKIIAPPTDCLSPIGEENLIKGLQKEVIADFYCATTRSPAVYRGNPFQIEVGLAYGGTQSKEDLVKVMRFANRVPLLYQPGACSTTESIVDTSWKNYGMSQSKGALPVGPLTIIIHIASVWVPFTSESKEAIAHYPEIIKEMKLALQEAGRKLAIYIHKNIRAAEQKERVDLFEKYIPELAASLSNLTGEKKEHLEEKLKKVLSKKMFELMEGIEPEQEKEENINERQQTLGENEE